MNWLYIGLPLAGFYVVWFSILLFKRRFDKYLLLVGLAHIPYLLANVVAPFRGLLDEMYLGYNFGWLSLHGLYVPIVVGFIIIFSFTIASKAFLNQMDKLWEFAFLFDLALSIVIAFPVLFDVLKDPSGSKIQLGEYLTISGFMVALLLFGLFSGPTFYATWYSGKKVYSKYFSRITSRS